MTSDAPVSVLLPAGTSALASGPAGFAVLAGGKIWTGRSKDLQQVALPGGGPAVSVDVGRGFYVAADDAGRVFAWGDNSLGELGNGTKKDSVAPVRVLLPAGQHFTSVAAGEHFAVAVTDDGVVYTWGSDSEGQLGDGRSSASTRPVRLKLPDLGNDRVLKVAAGARHALALTAAGTVLSWGSNVLGQRATGTSLAAVVKLPGKAISVSAGYGFSVAVLSDGSARAWGDNAEGQLGIGSTQQQSAPAAVKLDQRLTQVVAGDRFAVAITQDGSVVAWGDGSAGQLGDGKVVDRLIPVQVVLPAGVKVSALATSSGSVLALAGASPVTRISVSATGRVVGRPIVVAVAGYAADGTSLGLIGSDVLQVQMVGGTCTGASCTAAKAGLYEVRVQVVGTDVSGTTRVAVGADPGRATANSRTATSGRTNPATASASATSGQDNPVTTSAPVTDSAVAPGATAGPDRPDSARSHGWLWVIGALVVLALGIGGALLVNRRRRSGTTQPAAPQEAADTRQNEVPADGHDDPPPSGSDDESLPGVDDETSS